MEDQKDARHPKMLETKAQNLRSPAVDQHSTSGDLLAYLAAGCRGAVLPAKVRSHKPRKLTKPIAGGAPPMQQVGFAGFAPLAQ